MGGIIGEGYLRIRMFCMGTRIFIRDTRNRTIMWVTASVGMF